MSNVFASAKGMVWFESEPSDDDTAPSEDFSQTRIKRARLKYICARDQLEHNDNSGINLDPPLLEARHGFFGRVKRPSAKQ